MEIKIILEDKKPSEKLEKFARESKFIFETVVKPQIKNARKSKNKAIKVNNPI